MRSTICTSLAFTLSFGLAWAQPAPGCYLRTYDAGHLAANPDQVVSSIRLRLGLADGTEGMNAAPGTVIAVLDVVLARQGHVIRPPFDAGYPEGFGGAEMYQTLLCNGTAGRTCGMECMGVEQAEGFDVIAQEPAGLTIRTHSLHVGEGQDCGGFVDIAAVPGQPAIFELDRVADAVCDPDREG